MSESQQLAVRPVRNFSLLPGTLGEAKEIATIIANSGLAPKDYVGKPDMVLVAIQMGADLGLKPMQALQNIAVINGRPSIWGDAAAALVQGSGQIERFHETFEGTFPEDTFKAVCIVKRKDWPDEIRREFSIQDAKTAKLWNKKGHNGGDTPWVTYPKRMLQMRARGFALRDVASDMLMGLVLVEEAQDTPIEGHVISSEVVPDVPPALGVFQTLPEATRDNVEKAFETLAMAPGARLAKINEHFGGEGIDAEAQAALLLDWLRDEFAKRKTGQPRTRKADNSRKGQSEAPTGDADKAAGKPSDPPAAAPKAEGVDLPASPAPAAPVAATTPAAANVESDLF